MDVKLYKRQNMHVDFFLFVFVLLLVKLDQFKIKQYSV